MENALDNRENFTFQQDAAKMPHVEKKSSGNNIRLLEWVFRQP